LIPQAGLENDPWEEETGRKDYENLPRTCCDLAEPFALGETIAISLKIPSGIRLAYRFRIAAN